MAAIYFWRGNGEIRTMVLSNAEAVDAYPLGEHSLCNDVAQRLRLCLRTAVAVDTHITECVDTHFEHELGLGKATGGGIHPAMGLQNRICCPFNADAEAIDIQHRLRA